MIHLDKSDDLWTATIDRPEKANALTRQMLLDLAEIAESASAAKVFVLTGTGTVFSAGADLKAAKAGLATDPVWERLSGAIAALPGLTIAALNGSLAGGACGMALACDLRICAEQAKFFYPVMKLGFLPQPSDPKRLTALVGPSRAKLILMGGAKLTAPQAYQIGLVDAVVPKDDLGTKTSELSADARGADFKHVSGIKALFG